MTFRSFGSLADAFAYYTESQLATLEELEDTKRVSNVRLSRQRDIAWGMVEECKRHGVVPSPGILVPRLRKMLANAA